MESIKSLSASVMPFATSAEYPPIKLTPISLAARSKASAISAKSSLLRQAEPPISAIGVTDTRLLTIGMPYSREMASPVSTNFPARRRMQS